MEYSEFTYRKLLSSASSNNLVLPNFQRAYVWKIDEQAQLLASFLVNLPIGTFLLLEGSGQSFYSLELCFDKSVARENVDRTYLLDGQQRLSTIKNIFYDHFKGVDFNDTWDSLHAKLRYRWFLSVNETGSEDFLGYKNLTFIDRLSKSEKPKLTECEPNDIINSIKYYKVNKTVNHDKFYHPKSTEELTEIEKEVDLPYKYAEEGLLPLSDVLSDGQALFSKTLEVLALKQVDRLKAEAKDDMKKIVSVLGVTSPKEKTKILAKDQRYIDLLWQKKAQVWQRDVSRYFDSLFDTNILVPKVESSELARATSVFEYMNKGGTALDTFDIVVATYAHIGQELTLYNHLENSLSEHIDVPSSLNTSEGTYSAKEQIDLFKDKKIIKPITEAFLNIISVLNRIKKGNEVSINDMKKKEILSLSKDDISSVLEKGKTGLVRALAFYQYRCGFDQYSRLNYKLMLIPVAIVLSNDNHWNNPGVINKLEYWYWTSLFSARYRDKQNIRVVEDINELLLWVENSSDGESIKSRRKILFSDRNHNDESTFLLEGEDTTVPSAMHNGILCYILSLNPKDFAKEDQILKAWEIFREGRKLQDHHMITLGSTLSIGENSKDKRMNRKLLTNTPLNRVLITSGSNSKLKSIPFDRYIREIDSDVCSTNLIPVSSIPDASVVNGSSTQEIEFYKDRFQLIVDTLNRELIQLTA